MILEVIGIVASAFGGFFSAYSALDFALGISGFAGIAIAMWSITRFLVLPILGGHFSISDGDADILTETVTETTTVADKPKKGAGGQTLRHSVTRSSTRSNRRKVSRK